MEPVFAILENVQTEPTPKPSVSILWYVVGTGVAVLAALKLLSPGCVMSETDDGLSTFSVGKALLVSFVAMALVYYILTKTQSS